MDIVEFTKQEHIKAIAGQIRAYVDEKYPLAEREQLQAIAGRISLRSRRNDPVDAGVVAYIEACMTFVENAIVYASDLADVIAAKTTIDEVIAVQPDFTTLTMPTKRKVGEVIKTLRGV
jgi:hypothetical protein